MPNAQRFATGHATVQTHRNSTSFSGLSCLSNPLKYAISVSPNVKPTAIECRPDIDETRMVKAPEIKPTRDRMAGDVLIVSYIDQFYRLVGSSVGKNGFHKSTPKKGQVRGVACKCTY